MEPKKSLYSQDNSKQKEQNITLPYFKLHYKAMVTKTEAPEATQHIYNF